MAMSSITPYQDPVFGERPTYERPESSKRTEEMMHQQDEIMTDVYDMPTESEEGSTSILEDGYELLKATELYIGRTMRSTKA